MLHCARLYSPCHQRCRFGNGVGRKKLTPPMRGSEDDSTFTTNNDQHTNIRATSTTVQRKYQSIGSWAATNRLFRVHQVNCLLRSGTPRFRIKMLAKSS